MASDPSGCEPGISRRPIRSSNWDGSRTASIWLTRISGVEWAECWETKVEGEIDGIPVFILGREAYLKNKHASGRPQDLADASRLEEIGED